MPNCCAVNVLFELLSMYQFPVSGRNTDTSVLPSPSKSTKAAPAALDASPKIVNLAACDTENPFAAPGSYTYHLAKSVLPTSAALSGIAKLTEAQPLPEPVF